MYAVFDENNDNERIAGTGVYWSFLDAQEAAREFSRADDTVWAVCDNATYDADGRIVRVTDTEWESGS